MSEKTLTFFQTTVVWFDGNRDAALKKYEDRSKAAATSLADLYSRMYAFYLQMFRIENSKVVEQLKPIVYQSVR